MLTKEREKLYPLPGYPFDPCKRVTGRVDRFCTVRFDTNNYSVPAAYCGREVSVKAGPETVSIYFEGQCIARHRWCLDRKQNIIEDTVVVQAVDLHAYDAFLCGKAGAVV